MSKEICFRVPTHCIICGAKSFDIYEWIGGSFSEINFVACNHKSYEIVGDPEQFTGKYDKEHNEVFENDILQHDGGYKGVVEWDEFSGCWEFAHSFSEDVGILLLKIGNMHENNELLGR